MDGYAKHEKGGEFVTYERLRAMGTNGFQEPAVDFKDGKIVGTKRLYADGKFGEQGRQGHLHGNASGAACRRPARRQRRRSAPFLINNGRTNHRLAERLSRPGQRVRHGSLALPVHRDEPGRHDGARASRQGDLVEVYNDNGSTQAMVYPTPTAKRKQTFMLFAYPTGVQGNVVSPASTSSSSRTTSRPGRDIRKLADAPEGVQAPDASSRRSTRRAESRCDARQCMAPDFSQVSAMRSGAWLLGGALGHPIPTM